MIIPDDDLNRWSEEVIITIMNFTNKNGLKIWFSSDMQKQVLNHTLKVIDNIDKQSKGFIESIKL